MPFGVTKLCGYSFSVRSRFLIIDLQGLYSPCFAKGARSAGWAAMSGQFCHRPANLNLA